MKKISESIEYEDISGSSTLPKMSLKDNKYFVIHHAATDTDENGILNILNNRGLGVQWIINRDGKLFKTSKGNMGYHVVPNKSSAPKDLSNRTAQGVEVSAKNDEDVLEDIQCPTVLKLIRDILNIPKENIYGHGELQTNKQPTEGQKCKRYVLAHWGDEAENQDDEVENQDNEVENQDNEVENQDDIKLDLSNPETQRILSLSDTEASKELEDLFGVEIKETKNLKEQVFRINDLIKKIL